MKLIREFNESVKLLTEADTTGKKAYYIEGVFMQAGIANKNKRLYSLDILKEEVSRYTTEMVKLSRAYGELGHPDSPTINLERVSHMIKALTLEGANFVGRAKVMDTPYGNIVKSLIDEGAQLGVSSRGMGNLVPGPNGINTVHDFHLATAADIVADPSAPDAFVRGIMEGKEWVFVDGRYVEEDMSCAKRAIEQSYRSIDRREQERVAIRLFEGFMRKL
jgi:hypothetical protein